MIQAFWLSKLKDYKHKMKKARKNFDLDQDMIEGVKAAGWRAGRKSIKDGIRRIEVITESMIHVNR